MFRGFIVAILMLLGSQPAQARATKACFSPEDVKTMYLKRDAVSKGASQCMQNYWQSHNQFFKQNRYSKYFGNRNKALDNADKRARAILMIYWPDVLPAADLNKFYAMHRAEALKKNPKAEDTTPGLSQLEWYMKTYLPERYSEYVMRKPSFNLNQRASEEQGDREKRLSDLRGNTNLPMQNISCVDMTRRCLREGFQAAGMDAIYEKVDKEVRASDLSGVVMQKALSDLGWKILYFNPDPSKGAEWDEEEKKILPLKPSKCDPATATSEAPCPKPMVWQGAWGGHNDGWNLYCEADGTLRKGKKYGGLKCSDYYLLGGETPIYVDDKKLLVGFGSTVPPVFTGVPFWVGTAHAGYHVFPGFSGRIIEAHSMRAIKSQDNLEMSVFNPLDQDHHGGPRWTNTEHYRSGVIAVPPGYLDENATLHTPKVDAEGCVDIHPAK